MAREGLSKKQRFDVFKRDAFTCQYCGRHPPEVTLEVDHITAVSKGGDNAPHNLITSCFDCNRGKAAGTLDAAALDVSERAALLEERLAQSKAYDKLLRKERQERDKDVDRVMEIYAKEFPGWELLGSARRSISHFLKHLPATTVEEAMELACSRMNSNHAFRYFCGICWNKIKDE